MQSVYIQSYFPPRAGDHLPVSALCLRETRTMFILINEENKKVDTAKGVTELAETSSLCFFNKPELLSMCIAEGTSSSSWQGR